MKPWAYSGAFAVVVGVLALPVAWLYADANASPAPFAFPALFIVAGAALVFAGRRRARRRPRG